MPSPSIPDTFSEFTIIEELPAFRNFVKKNWKPACISSWLLEVIKGRWIVCDNSWFSWISFHNSSPEMSHYFNYTQIKHFTVARPFESIGMHWIMHWIDWEAFKCSGMQVNKRTNPVRNITVKSIIEWDSTTWQKHPVLEFSVELLSRQVLRKDPPPALLFLARGCPCSSNWQTYAHASRKEETSLQWWLKSG